MGVNIHQFVVEIPKVYTCERYSNDPCLIGLDGWWVAWRPVRIGLGPSNNASGTFEPLSSPVATWSLVQVIGPPSVLEQKRNGEQTRL